MLAIDACAVQFSRTRLYLVTACLSLVKFCSADIALQLEHGQKAFLWCTCVNLLLFMCIVLPFSVPKIKPQWCSTAFGLVLVLPLILLSTIQTVALCPTVFFASKAGHFMQLNLTMSSGHFSVPKRNQPCTEGVNVAHGLDFPLYHFAQCDQLQVGQPATAWTATTSGACRCRQGWEYHTRVENIVWKCCQYSCQYMYVTCRKSDSQPQLG